MDVRIVSYTANGRETASRAARALTASGHACRTYAQEKFCKDGDEPLTVSASEWAKDGFAHADALVFVCASGIAVRAIAPWIRDKQTDPAVLVLDEKGTFVISLLSGHIGGANALAAALAQALGATPVITTATDANGLFAVDVFAKDNRLFLTDMTLAKEISAALLRGEPVGFKSELPTLGALPKGLTTDGAAIGIYVGTTANAPFPKTLWLVPKRYTAGIGCRRGISAEALCAFFREQLSACGVSARELLCVVSIDLKKDEPGLLALCDTFGLPLKTHSAAALNAVPGGFSGSDFVRSATGVDCVCERAAVIGGGRLVVKKTARDGMTFALAKSEEAIRFV